MGKKVKLQTEKKVWECRHCSGSTMQQQQQKAGFMKRQQNLVAICGGQTRLEAGS
jgi:DnaJ-class molecular chaperone